jgi:hypothetical protein
MSGDQGNTRHNHHLQKRPYGPLAPGDALKHFQSAASADYSTFLSMVPVRHDHHHVLTSTRTRGTTHTVPVGNSIRKQEEKDHSCPHQLAPAWSCLPRTQRWPAGRVHTGNKENLEPKISISSNPLFR